MDNTQGSFPDDFSQEVSDLIDATVEDANPSRAVNRMEEALKQGLPKSQAADAYMVLGTRYEDLNQIGKAIDCYSKAIQLHMNNPILYYWRGELLFQQGQYEEARIDLEKALSFAPPNSLFSPEYGQAQNLLKQIRHQSK
jgi:tetratricopeptide (TPR) repeat protein